MNFLNGTGLRLRLLLGMLPVFALAGLWFSVAIQPVFAQGTTPEQRPSTFQGETTQEYNQRLEQLRKMLEGQVPPGRADESRIGPEDLLEVTVFEAPELNRSLRVSGDGEISLPLLGSVKAGGLTPKELEFVLQELLRRTYMKDPHVGVSIRELQSHPVFVFGAVKKPGVFQIRGTKSLLELLSMAEGLADDAGATVLVIRGLTSPGPNGADSLGQEQEKDFASSPSAAGKPQTSGPANIPERQGKREVAEINLKNLLESGDPRYNVPIHAGDVVKVTRAGVVYVVGEVKRPGGFVLKSNENISVLQALAMAEGFTRTAARSQARIIRTDQGTDKRVEIPVDLGKVLAGKAPDAPLQPKDIVFIPNSAGRSALYRGAEAAISLASGVLLYRSASF